MRNNNFLGLPTLSLNLLSAGLFIFLICLGIRTIKSPDLALSVANTQLITSTSADKLEKLAIELEQQAKSIEQKDKAYKELEAIYQRSLKGDRGYGKLQEAIETIDELPEVDKISEITNQIIETEKVLSEVEGLSIYPSL